MIFYLNNIKLSLRYAFENTLTLEQDTVEFKKQKEDLESIFMAGVRRVDPHFLIQDSVTLQNEHLIIRSGNKSERFDLSEFNRIFVAGFGKATARMAMAVEEILGERISKGVIAVKYGHTERLKKIDIIEAGHPVPDENGLHAAHIIADLASGADEKTVIITLISGGGSALIPYPWKGPCGGGDVTLTLAEKQTVTRVLLECGASIAEINAVRKHLSRIKGGRLSELMAPATSINLILSDVVGDRLDIIASGATSPDISTFMEMRTVFEKYGITGQMPENVLKILRSGLKKQIPETPKPGDKIFDNVNNMLIGTNSLALSAAQEEAELRGYQSQILTSQLVGEAREMARELSEIARKYQKRKVPHEKPFCLLFGGESTVTIHGDGKGGRNQELALSFLSEMVDNRSAMDRISFLSGGTDGNDGPTDAAGAFATVEMLNRARKKGLSHMDYLNNNDAYHFFEAINGLLKTGPTNTNVCDIQVILIH